MTNFHFQNKDTILANISIDKNRIILHSYSKVLDDLYYNFEDWIHNRIEVSNRLNIYDMCKIAGMRNLEDYAKYTNSISVSDTFWMNDTNNLKTWNQISLYNNRISKIIADIALNGITLLNGQNIKSPSPQYKLGGSADKCIKRHGNKNSGSIYLYKSCGELWREPMNVRPYSEYLVNQFEKELNFKSYVNYSISEYNTDTNKIKPYSICKLFTNENIGIVDYDDSIYKNTSLYDLRKMCIQKGLKQDYDIITEMIILDSIILNIDRHGSNYGFLFNTNNLQYIGITPIFDNDCSLGSTISLKEKTFNDAYNELINRGPRTKLGTFDEQALKFINKEIYSKLKKLDLTKFNFNFSGISGISENRKEFINYLVNRRISEIVELTEKTYNIK